jgi:FlaA1/EpsC-like NDP-sugar epimerase
VRGGNVMGSNGSVIPYFIEQIKAGGPITITDQRMTRFFLTLEEAIELLFKAAIASLGGETFVMNMPACYIRDVAKVLMNHYGTVDIKEIGSKPGEKLDEILIGRNESSMAHSYDNTYFVILPRDASQAVQSQYHHLPALPWDEYSSKSSMMSSMEIGKMLQKGGFI